MTKTKHSLLIIGGAITVFIVTRIISLAKLPVFADEAIYLHWAQVAANEPEKYLFLPMLDGKPPLHTWLLIPFATLVQDPLWGGRLLSVLAGLATVCILDRLIVHLGGKKAARLVGFLIVTFAPFWHFHHRMALAESLLSLWFSASLLFGLRSLERPSWKNALLLGLSLGVALWTKTSAFFFLPILILLPLLEALNKAKKLNKGILFSFYNPFTGGHFAIGLIIGLLTFTTLKLSPLFPYLFTRSLDYTFTVQEIIGGEWRYVIGTSLPRILGWLIWYFSPFLFVPLVASRTKSKLLLFLGLIFLIPLVMFGRVLSPRYFFPIAPLFTVACALALENLRSFLTRKLIVSFFLIYSSVFLVVSWWNPDYYPFVATDRTQYLEDWSSGHGIREVADFIEKRLEKGPVTVATEGFFGTLPDGLAIYFNKPKYEGRLEVIGVGQPITAFREDLLAKAKERELYLVVNADRLSINPLPEYLKVIDQFERPNNAPPLLLLRVTFPKHE